MIPYYYYNSVFQSKKSKISKKEKIEMVIFLMLLVTGLLIVLNLN